MAESPAHRFGQIIGEVLETAVEPLLEDFAKKHGLYLDRKGPRAARRGRKVSWKDSYGNSHDLDYVLERNGTPSQIGTPVAFIETAWRSYTKHSRAKAQEIQGAVLPLVDKHKAAGPFTGVVLAGVFTEGSLTQLRSLGFQVLFFPPRTVWEAFREAGIDAEFGEGTPDAELARKVNQWKALQAAAKTSVSKRLLTLNEEPVVTFMSALERAVTRQVERIRVLPLHGKSVDLPTAEEAITFIQTYRPADKSDPFIRMDILISLSDGSRIEGQFVEVQTAIEFLDMYKQPPITPDNT
jgi:hypothetical protein